MKNIKGYVMTSYDWAQAYDTAATCYPTSVEPDLRLAEMRGDVRATAILTVALAHQEQFRKAERRVGQMA
jgi:hypothetical protein